MLYTVYQTSLTDKGLVSIAFGHSDTSPKAFIMLAEGIVDLGNTGFSVSLVQTVDGEDKEIVEHFI